MPLKTTISCKISDYLTEAQNNNNPSWMFNRTKNEQKVVIAIK